MQLYTPNLVIPTIHATSLIGTIIPA